MEKYYVLKVVRTVRNISTQKETDYYSLVLGPVTQDESLSASYSKGITGVPEDVYLEYLRQGLIDE